MGTPQKDFRNNEWFMPAYSTTDTYEEWTTESAPFCSYYYAQSFGRDAFAWVDENVMGDIYLRRTFTTTQTLDGDVYLACGHDDAPAAWYINGVLVK